MSMKLVVGAVLVLAMAAFAQETKSPVVQAAREMMTAKQKSVIAAAEEMPEDKYGYKPTPQQRSFGEIVAHLAEHNYTVCSKLAGSQMPTNLATAKDTKAKLGTNLREAFDFCSGVLGKLDDSALGQTIDLYGGMTKAKAVMALPSDLSDHYAQMAMYLRMNGLLPPTAKK